MSSNIIIKDFIHRFFLSIMCAVVIMSTCLSSDGISPISIDITKRIEGVSTFGGLSIDFSQGILLRLDSKVPSSAFNLGTSISGVRDVVTILRGISYIFDKTVAARSYFSTKEAEANIKHVIKESEPEASVSGIQKRNWLAKAVIAEYKTHDLTAIRDLRAEVEKRNLQFEAAKIEYKVHCVRAINAFRSCILKNIENSDLGDSGLPRVCEHTLKALGVTAQEAEITRVAQYFKDGNKAQ